MIDFDNAKYLKLHPEKPDKFLPTVQPILLPGESIVACYQSVRDYLLFTTLRIISVNVQGVTGHKQDFTSLPYKRIQTFSIETAGMLDLTRSWSCGSPALARYIWSSPAARTSPPSAV